MLVHNRHFQNFKHNVIVMFSLNVMVEYNIQYISKEHYFKNSVQKVRKK